MNANDKGGMIFSPKIGLHENVAVLNYENEYANSIFEHNLSYGAVTSTTDGQIMLKNKGDLDLFPTAGFSRDEYFFRICRHHSSLTETNGFAVSIES